MLGWAVDHGRAHARDSKIRGVFLNEIEGSSFGKGLGGTVRNCSRSILIRCDFESNRIPVLLGVGVAWSSSFAEIVDGCEGRGDYNSLNGWVVLLDGRQDGSCAIDCRVK